MKKLVSISLLVMTSFGAVAQEEVTFQKNKNKHEFRIDALEILTVSNIDIEYEYVISRFSGAGLAVTYSLDDNFSIYQQYSINPYFRQYFFNKKDFGARGFFVEGLLKFAGGKGHKHYTYGYEDDASGNRVLTTFTEQIDEWSNFGIGIALGQKWVSDNGFVLELSLGGGRYFIEDKGPKGFFRGGISIGYRFF